MSTPKDAQSILDQINSEAMSRQDIYQALNQVSKDDFLDHEMKRLGFWDPDKTTAEESALSKLIEDKKEIEAKLVELQKNLVGKEDAELRLKAETEARIEQSRKEQVQRRKDREKQRKQRQALWEETQKNDIFFLGEEVSSLLSLTYESKEVQESNQVPPISTPQELAQILETDIPCIRVFGFFRPVSTFNHYHRFSIPKKTGGERIISAPVSRLKSLQKNIQEKILANVPIHDAAHGFVPNRSVYTNAIPHIGKKIVINMDLKNFFPTISFPRVRGCFTSLGYSPKIATILGLLCTEAPTLEATLNKKKWYIAQGERFLPQGAPTSPIITNIICRNLDARLHGWAVKNGAVYTRYADDLTFGFDSKQAQIGKFLFVVRKIIQEEGFVVHPDKTKVMRDGMRKEVTGVVVNEKASIPKKTMRKFDALLHHIEHDGPEGKYWGDSDDVLTAALGFASFIKMIDPEKGAPRHAKVKELCTKYR